MFEIVPADRVDVAGGARHRRPMLLRIVIDDRLAAIDQRAQFVHAFVAAGDKREHIARIEGQSCFATRGFRGDIENAPVRNQHTNAWLRFSRAGKTQKAQR